MSVEDRKDLVYLLGIMECMKTDPVNKIQECIQKLNLPENKKKDFIYKIPQIQKCFQSIYILPEFKGLSYYLYTGEDEEILRKSNEDLEIFYQTGDLDRFPFLSHVVNQLLDNCDSSLFVKGIVKRDTKQKVNAIITKGDKYLIVKENRWDPDFRNSFEGKWGFVKGGVKEGEDKIDALIREVSEELRQKIERDEVKDEIEEMKKKEYYYFPSKFLNERSLPLGYTREVEKERNRLREIISSLHFNKEGIYSPEYVYAIRKLMDLQGEIERVEWISKEGILRLGNRVNKSIKTFFEEDGDRRHSGYQRSDDRRYQRSDDRRQSGYYQLSDDRRQSGYYQHSDDRRYQRSDDRRQSGYYQRSNDRRRENSPVRSINERERSRSRERK
jgi:8-oxo-dGTP pyrophosphatase MutT (NUDIX family)